MRAPLPKFFPKKADLKRSYVNHRRLIAGFKVGDTENPTSDHGARLGQLSTFFRLSDILPTPCGRITNRQRCRVGQTLSDCIHTYRHAAIGSNHRRGRSSPPSENDFTATCRSRLAAHEQIVPARPTLNLGRENLSSEASNAHTSIRSSRSRSRSSDHHGHPS